MTFFRKELDLKIPPGYDIPVAMKLSGPEGQEVRVQIWVNGYQYGKVLPTLPLPLFYKHFTLLTSALLVHPPRRQPGHIRRPTRNSQLQRRQHHRAQSLERRWQE